MTQQMVQRKSITEMTDREIAEETLEKLRSFEDALAQLARNPMVSAMIPGGLKI